MSVEVIDPLRVSSILLFSVVRNAIRRIFMTTTSSTSISTSFVHNLSIIEVVIFATWGGIYTSSFWWIDSNQLLLSTEILPDFHLYYLCRSASSAEELLYRCWKGSARHYHVVHAVMCICCLLTHQSRVAAVVIFLGDCSNIVRRIVPRISSSNWTITGALIANGIYFRIVQPIILIQSITTLSGTINTVVLINQWGVLITSIHVLLFFLGCVIFGSVIDLLRLLRDRCIPTLGGREVNI